MEVVAGIVVLLGLLFAFFVGITAGPCLGVGVGLVVLMIASKIYPEERCEVCGQKMREGVRKQRVKGRRLRVCLYCDDRLRRLQSDEALARLIAPPMDLFDGSGADEIHIELEPDPSGRRRILGTLRRSR